MSSDLWPLWQWKSSAEMQWFDPFLTSPSPPLCLISPPLYYTLLFPLQGWDNYFLHYLFFLCFIIVPSAPQQWNALINGFQQIFNKIFVLCVKVYAGSFLINYAFDSMQSQSWWSWWIMHAHLIKSLSRFIFSSSLYLGLFQSLDIFFALYHL